MRGTSGGKDIKNNEMNLLILDVLGKDNLYTQISQL
jgi:hypothetical protein